jgi:hypothetical protein
MDQPYCGLYLRRFSFVAISRLRGRVRVTCEATWIFSFEVVKIRVLEFDQGLRSVAPFLIDVKD